MTLLPALRLPVVDAARALLGYTVEFGGCAGIIVETEAYHDTEPACHAFIGRTARTEVLFHAPGEWYLYRSYGIHALLNAVVEPEGVGAAVLIRALEPLAGLEAMRLRRGPAARTDFDLCSGPGKLSQALGIDLDLNGTDVATGPIRLGAPPVGWESPPIAAGLRIGITKAADLPWRFCVAGNRHVSRPRPPLI
ncbi:MAG: DNA-3-methyladenine glycosylase [Solirubrobacteraceae bacterium]|nr:DNA-3-methyladenine glycosylase [Solirubrobacteraceae bacterium]